MHCCIDGGWLVGCWSCIQYTVSMTRIHHAIHFPTEPHQPFSLQLKQKEITYSKCRLIKQMKIYYKVEWILGVFLFIVFMCVCVCACMRVCVCFKAASNMILLMGCFDKTLDRNGKYLILSILCFEFLVALYSSFCIVQRSLVECNSFCPLLSTGIGTGNVEQPET